jgi:two-component system, NtrC family, response regulator AtoC
VTDDRETMDAGMTGSAAAAGEDAPAAERAFLVVYNEGRSRVVDLPEGIDVTFGRSRDATVHIDHERVSRLHARVVRRGADILVEDLGSRNGTRVNGRPVSGPTRAASGDEIAVGPAVAVVGVTKPLRRRALVGSISYLEERLAAEIDRATRYHRPLGLLMLRIGGAPGATDAAVARVAASLRRMDCLAEYAPDELAVVIPESTAPGTRAAARRLAAEARAAGLAAGGVAVAVGHASYPQDGAQPGELISRARAALRLARAGRGDDGVAGAPAEAAPAAGDRVVLDPAMVRLYELAGKIADTSIGVLILGETGAGKELVAEELHRRSGRSARPFIKLNCASLPETLLESELFGHERGAFTGAERRKAGFFEAADGGTILLDEIGELPVGLQPKLLRVIEGRRITRVGGTTEIEVDVRVVCATNRDLEKEVARGRFREDLYFRISAFSLLVPPLRDRPSEIRPLAEHFARRFAAEMDQEAPRLSDQALATLAAYPWPGNVRELRNAMERAVVLQQGGIIEREHLPERVTEGIPVGDASPMAIADGVDMRVQIAEVERAAIVAALEACGGNQTHAAQRLGLSRRALIYKLEKYGLKRPPTGRGT